MRQIKGDVVKYLALIIVSAAFAGNIPINPGPADDDGIWLKYHDGTPAWCSWDGVYRGVWFNVWDFYPGATVNFVEQTAFWFYHHVSYPWDTSDVYVEVWNGDAQGPVVQLEQTMVTAVHYAPVYVEHFPELIVEADFWPLVNTELSAGGWPSVPGDGGQSGSAHSFYSNDFINWQPWNPAGICNYFMAVDWVGWRLEGTTWGSIKSSF